MIAPRIEAQEACPVTQNPMGPRRLNLLVGWIGLSMTALSDLTGREVSRSQIHRILRGARATSAERAAVYSAVCRALAKCDSAFLFEDV